MTLPAITKLRALALAAILGLGFGVTLPATPAKAQWGWGYDHRYYGHGYRNDGYRDGWRHERMRGPRCYWTTQRVWSPRLHRHVRKDVRVCR